jgi:hypothetical protein
MNKPTVVQMPLKTSHQRDVNTGTTQIALTIPSCGASVLLGIVA